VPKTTPSDRCQQSPIDPIDGTRPESIARRVIAQDVNWLIQLVVAGFRLPAASGVFRVTPRPDL